MQLAQAQTPQQEPQQSPQSNAVDANWNCTAHNPGPAGVAVSELDRALTVGEPFVLVCEGDSVTLKADKLQIDLPKEQKYALKILKTQSVEGTKGIFTVTSYQVGDGEITGAVLTDGTLRVALNGISFKVDSVINKEENPEGKPYDPLEPLAIAWPTWIWIVLSIVLALIALFVLGILQASAQKRRLKQELARHGLALTPYQQLNKEFRQISRQYPLGNPAGWPIEQATSFLQDLDRSMRWFLAREFEVPAHEWRSPRTLKAIKKKNKKLPRSIFENLRSTLRELDRASAAVGRLTTVDAAQLVDLCRKSADEIHHAKKGAAA